MKLPVLDVRKNASLWEGNHLIGIVAFMPDRTEGEIATEIAIRCNSHDALVDALKDARYALYGDGPGNPKIDAAIKAGEVKG